MSLSLPDHELERAILDAMVPELEADGFRVVIHPKPDTLPTFLQGYRPDMVAYKDNKSVAIEIKPRPPAALSSTLTERVLRERLAKHPDWELRFVYAPVAYSDVGLPVASKQTIDEHLDRLAASMDAMGLSAALLMS